MPWQANLSTNRSSFMPYMRKSLMKYTQKHEIWVIIKSKWAIQEKIVRMLQHQRNHIFYAVNWNHNIPFETVYILSINLLFTFTVSECSKIVLTCLQWCIKISKIKKEKKIHFSIFLKHWFLKASLPKTKNCSDEAIYFCLK